MSSKNHVARQHSSHRSEEYARKLVGRETQRRCHGENVERCCGAVAKFESSEDIHLENNQPKQKTPCTYWRCNTTNSRCSRWKGNRRQPILFSVQGHKKLRRDRTTQRLHPAVATARLESHVGLVACLTEEAHVLEESYTATLKIMVKRSIRDNESM